MNQEAYRKVTTFFRRPGWPSAFIFLCGQAVPVLIGIVYIVCGLWLLISSRDWIGLIPYAAIPLIGFCVVTVIRSRINRKRPYEVYDYQPIKDPARLKKGQSFPSRHTASATLIAAAICVYIPVLGIPMILLAALTGISRVLAGLHFLSDVAAGWIYGIIVGIIGFAILIFLKI